MSCHRLSVKRLTLYIQLTPRKGFKFLKKFFNPILHKEYPSVNSPFAHFCIYEKVYNITSFLFQKVKIKPFLFPLSLIKVVLHFFQKNRPIFAELFDTFSHNPIIQLFLISPSPLQKHICFPNFNKTYIHSLKK